MKTIVVSQRVDSYPDRSEDRDALDQRMAAWVWACGYVPAPVPNMLQEKVTLWLTALNPAGVVLSGGNDIGMRPERDATEMALLEFAQQRNLPVLGICRGMQMLGHWAGVSLCPVQGHVATRHRLKGSITEEVNSYHGLVLQHCPTEFISLAHSSDGCLEAMAHVNLPWQGWMWHPEREPDFAEHDIQRFKEIFR